MKKLLLPIALGIFSTTSLANQVIEWNYNGKARALGTGCRKVPGRTGDTEFIEAGNEMSVIFSRLGVELTGHAGGKKVAKKTCRIIIPTKVRSGWYMAEMQQTLTYGYERTENTEGKVSLVSQFYNQSAGRIQQKIPTRGYDRYSEPFVQKSKTTRWRVRPNWCLRRDYKGNFKANLAVNGYRKSTSKDLVVQIDGHDIRFDAIGTPALCR